MKYKFKRFLKRNIKRILRTIIIFSIIACLSIPCFASTYDTFSDFMAGGNSEGWRYDQDGGIVDYFDANDMGNFDTIYIRSPGAGYGGTLDPYWFGGVELRYTNGINYYTSYVKGDYIYLQHQLYISTVQTYDITGTLGDFELDLSKTSISIYATDDYGATSVSTYVGRSFVKSITYDQWTDDVGSLFKSMLIDITLKQPLPSDGTQIYGITYNFPAMFAGESLYFNLSPSNSSFVVFDVGDPSTMATYPNFEGNTSIEEEERFSAELRQQALNALTGGFATIGNNATNFINRPMAYRGIVGASNLIDNILGNTHFRNLLWVSLSLGLSVFILNIGVSSIVKFSSKNKE